MPACSHSSTWGLISVSQNFVTERMSSRCCSLYIILRPSHASHAEARRVEGADLRLAADREAESQHPARIAGIDEPIVPEPRRGEERGRFALELLDDLALHGVELRPVDRLARALEALLGDDREHLRRLLATPDGDAVVGPGEDEAGIVGAAAPAVIAGAEARADMQRQLRHACIGHRLDHLRAVLDDAAPLRLGAH